MMDLSRSETMFDVIIAADFTAVGDRAFRVAQEVRLFAGRGLSVGLVQGRRPLAGEVIAPEIATCLRRGQARLSGGQGAALLVLHGPSEIALETLGLPWSALREVAVVCHTAADFEEQPRFGRRVKLRRHAVTPALRKLAGKRGDPVWLPVAEAMPAPQVAGRPPAVGWVGGCEGGCPPAGLEAFEHVDVAQVSVSLDRLVAGLDVLVLREGGADALVAAMLASGRAVVAVPALRAQYGAGPVYRDDLAEGVRLALATSGAEFMRAGYVRACRGGPVMRIGAGIGSGRAVPARAEARPILCLSSNGVGIGHLTRLLAIARKMGDGAEVVFATQAQAVGVVESFGYPVEYIPSPAAVGGDFAAWDGWFAAHLSRLIDRYDPALVIYDGNAPSAGLMAAVASRRDCRLAWVRRGMWGKTASRFMVNARWCDLVIEPGELAAARDTGATRARRGEALVVDPIRLLDPDDLLPRDKAAAHLGLNPARPAVLVQLGSGYNRDLLAMLDEIVAVLSAVPGLQIAVAEWVNGSVPLTLWPGVTVLRGFPVSQYLRAFDFSISAAGYNSFHELIGFAVPTIFVANRHPAMDDQYGRAKFAQDNAAAFEISESDLPDLAEMVPLLMQGVARHFLADQCRRLARPNGAGAAAAALLRLAGRTPSLAMAAE